MYEDLRSSTVLFVSLERFSFIKSSLDVYSQCSRRTTSIRNSSTSYTLMIDVRSLKEQDPFLFREKMRVSYAICQTLQSEQADEWRMSHSKSFIDSATPFTSWCHIVNERPDSRSSRSACENSANSTVQLGHLSTFLQRERCLTTIRLCQCNQKLKRLMRSSALHFRLQHLPIPRDFRLQTARVYRDDDNFARELASSPNSTITFESWHNCCVDRMMSPEQQVQAICNDFKPHDVDENCRQKVKVSDHGVHAHASIPFPNTPWLRQLSAGRPLRPRTLQLYAQTDGGHKHRVDGPITSWCETRVWKRDVRQSVFCLTRDRRHRVLRFGMDLESEGHPGWSRPRRSSFNARHRWTWVQTARQQDGMMMLMQHVQRADGCIESRNIHRVPMPSHWRPFVARRWRGQVPGRRHQAWKTCACWLRYTSPRRTTRMAVRTCISSGQESSITMTPTSKVSSAPTVWSSRSAHGSMRRKPSSCRLGILRVNSFAGRSPAVVTVILMTSHHCRRIGQEGRGEFQRRRRAKFGGSRW